MVNALVGLCFFQVFFSAAGFAEYFTLRNGTAESTVYGSFSVSNDEFDGE